MKVKDLIEMLQEIPEDTEIRMFWHSGECEVGITKYDDIYYLVEGEEI